MEFCGLHAFSGSDLVSETESGAGLTPTPLYFQPVWLTND